MTKLTDNTYENGLRIPSDEVLIINEKEESFNGTVLGISNKFFKYVATSQKKAIRGLEEIAMHHIANALVQLKIKVRSTRGRDFYTAKAKIAQVAVPIADGEVSPLKTYLDGKSPKERDSGRVYFSLEEAEGSAEHPPVNTFFTTLEEAKASLCFRLFDGYMQKAARKKK